MGGSMRNDLDKRMNLRDRFAKMIALGLWSDSIAVPDGQILERIQRLNEDIETQIKELYIPENQIENKINNIKLKIYQESQNGQINKKQPSQAVSSHGLHLGKGVSNWLNFIDEDTEKLKKLKLPSLKTLEELSTFLDTKQTRLLWLIYHNDIGTKTHYTDFTIQKGDKRRKISNPCRALRSIQTTIKEKILDNIKLPNYIHGFIKGHNIMDNVKPHLTSNSIVNIDIKNFFPSIRFVQVRSVFHDLGYSGMTASILALATTKQDAKSFQIGEKLYWKFSSNRYLPQGASTSPMISNLVAAKFDNQLFRRAEKLDFKYSRYADDLTFSTSAQKPNHKAILYLARKTLELHGFNVNPKKVKILFPYHQQQITGININSGKATIPRSWRRKLRAAVHQFRFIKDQKQKSSEFNRIYGSIQFLKLTHPKLAKQYEIEINRYNQISEYSD